MSGSQRVLPSPTYQPGLSVASTHLVMPTSTGGPVESEPYFLVSWYHILVVTPAWVVVQRDNLFKHLYSVYSAQGRQGASLDSPVPHFYASSNGRASLGRLSLPRLSTGPRHRHPQTAPLVGSVARHPSSPTAYTGQAGSTTAAGSTLPGVQHAQPQHHCLPLPPASPLITTC
jgi:hypothetical protein